MVVARPTIIRVDSSPLRQNAAFFPVLLIWKTESLSAPCALLLELPTQDQSIARYFA